MYNKTTFIGNLGKDPEMRYTPAGAPVTSFSVACNRQYTNTGGELIKETMWFRVSTWNKLAEVCQQYLHKGSKVLIEGRLVADKSTGGPRIWSKQDGTASASFEVTASAVEFLSPKSDGTVSEAAHDGDGQQVENSETPPEDDIPF
jgi:single-strand DNA-binding protein